MIFMPEPERVSPVRRVYGHATMFALYLHAKQTVKARSHETAIMSAIAMRQGEDGGPVALSGSWS